jgi:hypothetical protein
MSVDVEVAPAGKINFFTLRLAAAVIAGNGVLTLDAACAIAADARGRRPVMRVREALRPLIELDVLVRVDDSWYASNMADLAAWLADAVEAREDAGMLVNPTIPAPRDGHRSAA